MAKTFNRRPLQVNTPSSNDIKNYFFNHYNWKGVNKDKNFFAVDQETFADAKNVYTDAEGLLRSRPSIKHRSMFFDSAIDFWNFDDVDAYIRKVDEIYTLYFVIDDVAYDKSIINEKIKLVRIQNIIYCFTENDFFYFDVDEKTFGDGANKVYIPNTVFNVNGVVERIESKNVLTDKEKQTYLYNREFGISTEAYGKSLSVKIDNKEYQTTFNEFTKELLTDVLFDLPDEYDGLVVSLKNTYLFYSIENRTFSYSSSGKSISKTFVLPEEYGDIVSEPKFSQDSAYVIIATKKSVYIASVLIDSSVGVNRFEDFTDIIAYSNVNDFWPEYENKPFDPVQKVDFDFATYDSFVITIDSFSASNHQISILSVKGDVVYTKKDIEGPNNFTFKIHYSDTLEMFVLFIFDYSMESFAYYLYDSKNLDSPNMFDSGDAFKINTDVKIINNKLLYLKNVSQIDGSTAYNTNKIIVGEINRNDDGVEFVMESENSYLYDYHFNKHFISSDGFKVFTGGGIYYIKSGTYREILVYDRFNEAIAYTDYVYFVNQNGRVFSSLVEGTLEFNYITPGENKLFNPKLLSKLNEFYLVSGKNLYITEYREEDGEFRWYLPEINKQVFDTNITGLHPISTTEMGIFFEDEIWYGYPSEQGYRYTKSKLELGVKFGSDIIASYDGGQLIFPTERGIAVLSYQDFVASTDQVIAFLSDSIHSEMKEFCKKSVLLFKNDYWILVYRKDLSTFYILDTRNNSWWPWSLNSKTKKFVKYGDDLILHSVDGKFYSLDSSNEDYFDYDTNKHPIEWNVTSQKLHLSNVNNYKHIVNMTFNSVIDTNNLSFFLDIKNYRENVDTGKIENPHYSVDVLRTFVQRLNYFKVNEFQYTLRSDNENEHPLPLSLSSISIKYKIQGQVR